MAERSLHIAQPLDVVWERLQQLESWEGIGGMDQLHDASHHPDGSLAGFAYSLDTPIGTIHDTADVTSSSANSDQRWMHVRTETKGLRVTIELDITAAGDTTTAAFTIDAEATNFLARPLASTLRHTLDSGIVRESDRMLERLEVSNP